SGVTVARPIALRTVSARSESARERHRGSSGARTRRGASRLLEYDAAQRSVRAGAVRWAPHGGASGGCVAAVSLARLASRAGNSRSRSNSVADAPSRGGSKFRHSRATIPVGRAVRITQEKLGRDGFAPREFRLRTASARSESAPERHRGSD